MVATARAPESPENKVSVPFTYDESVPPNAEVYVRYSLDDWKTDNTEKLAKHGGRFQITLEMDERTSYKYVYRIVVPGQPDQWKPEGGIGKYYEGIAEEKAINSTTSRHGSHASHSSSDALRRDVKAEVSHILTSAKDARSADRIGNLVEGLEFVIRQRHSVREDVTNLVLSVLAEVIREDRTLPDEIRSRFDKENPLADFRDLTRRLEEGSRLFRQAVFLRLAGDESSRKFFKLDARARYNDSDPLGNPKFNEVFRRHCDSKCLSAGKDYFEKHLQAVAEKEVVDPTLLAARMSDADRIIRRLPPAEQSVAKKMLKEIPTERKSQVLDWVIHGWGLASATGIDGGIGITVCLLKALAEGTTGVSLREVMSSVDKGGAKPVIDAALKNNVIVHWIKNKGGLWNRVKETVGRAIPIYAGVKHAGKSVSGFEAEGMGGEDSGTVSADKLISGACDSAINPSK